MSAGIRLTDEEFLNLPDEPGKQEVLDGELMSLPPAKHRYDIIIQAFYEHLRTFLPRARVRIKAGYKLRPGRWLQPDVSVTWPDQPAAEWLEGAPMIAIEIASAGNAYEDMDRKLAAYLEDGASEIWVVSAKTRSMTVFKQNGAQRITAEHRCEALNATIDLPALLS